MLVSNALVCLELTPDSGSQEHEEAELGTAMARWYCDTCSVTRPRAAVQAGLGRQTQREEGSQRHAKFQH